MAISLDLPASSVSMKSGLEGRNNKTAGNATWMNSWCLNEVRPRRPEQFVNVHKGFKILVVSMKSGLEGRNNAGASRVTCCATSCLNEVRPRRPEQSFGTQILRCGPWSLNEVRPRRPEQWQPPDWGKK